MKLSTKPQEEKKKDSGLVKNLLRLLFKSMTKNQRRSDFVEEVEDDEDVYMNGMPPLLASAANIAKKLRPPASAGKI
jgi:hypothetical protein